MKLQNLEDKVIDLTNILISNYNILDEYWAYHPSNENFINYKTDNLTEFLRRINE